MADRGEPLLDLDSRRKIFRHIERNPGLHLRGLQRTLGMPLGTIEYHLHQMEKVGLIVSRDDGRFKAFFAKDGLDRRDKDILYYVRQEMPRQIVIQLLMAPRLTHSELTASLPVSASTCSFHLKKLVKAEIVDEERVGRSKRFTVREAERVAGVLVRYRRSFLDDLVDRFARAWLDLDHGTAAGTAPDEEDEPAPDPELQTELLLGPPGTDETDAEDGRRVAIRPSDEAHENSASIETAPPVQEPDDEEPEPEAPPFGGNGGGPGGGPISTKEPARRPPRSEDPPRAPRRASLDIGFFRKAWRRAAY